MPKGDVTRIAEGGSRTSEIEAEFLSAVMDNRRVAKEAANAGSEGTQKVIQMSTRNGTEAKFSINRQGSLSESRKRRKRWKQVSLEIVKFRDGGRNKSVKSRVPPKSERRRRKEEQ